MSGPQPKAFAPVGEETEVDTVPAMPPRSIPSGVAGFAADANLHSQVPRRETGLAGLRKQRTKAPRNTQLSFRTTEASKQRFVDQSYAEDCSLPDLFERMLEHYTAVKEKGG